MTFVAIKYSRSNFSVQWGIGFLRFWRSVEQWTTVYRAVYRMVYRAVYFAQWSNWRKKENRTRLKCGLGGIRTRTLSKVF